MGPQVVEFNIESEPISVSARDAARLVERLRSRGLDACVCEAGRISCVSAADKIERATELHTDTTTITLAIGEDECVLAVLGELRATGDFLKPLARLERATKAKIDRTAPPA